MMSDPSWRISALSRPAGADGESERSELLHTISARCAVACASVRRVGRISNSSTATPRRANCQVASVPASPPPITRTMFSMSAYPTEQIYLSSHMIAAPAIMLEQLLALVLQRRATNTHHEKYAPLVRYPGSSSTPSLTAFYYCSATRIE